MLNGVVDNIRGQIAMMCCSLVNSFKWNHSYCIKICASTLRCLILKQMHNFVIFKQQSPDSYFQNCLSQYPLHSNEHYIFIHKK